MPTKLIIYDKYKHKKYKYIVFGKLKSIQFRDYLYQKKKKIDPASIECQPLMLNVGQFKIKD